MKGPDNSSDRTRDASRSSSTSLNLLVQVKQGDPQSWDRLMSLYRPLVLWWCRCHVPRPEDAEDVAQDVFMTVHKKIVTFTRGERPGSFRAWLRGITYRKLGEYFRRARHQPAAAGGSEAQEILTAMPDEFDEDASADEVPSERCILLRSALELIRADFEPNTWEAALRAAVDGQGAADVAEALGMTARAVYTAKSRVLKRLREVMDDLLD
jgi:RNA polymerase sigma-70 factor (ECF subfamily)